MLVLAGLELIFFIVTNTGPGFGFALETVLIIQGCFCYGYASLHKSLLFLTPSHQ